MNVDEFGWKEPILNRASAPTRPNIARGVVEWLCFDNIGDAVKSIEHDFDPTDDFGVCWNNKILRHTVVTTAYPQ